MFQWSKYQTVGSLWIPILVDQKPQTAVIHIGLNDITKFNYHDVYVNDLANGILQIGLKCRYYDVKVLLFRLFLLQMKVILIN